MEYCYQHLGRIAYPMHDTGLDVNMLNDNLLRDINQNEIIFSKFT